MPQTLAIGRGAFLVAWFVSASAVGKTLATNTGTLTAQKTDKTLGSFTFTPKFTAPSSSDLVVDLTNSSGQSKLWTDSSMTGTIDVNPGNPTADFTITGIEVSYTAGTAGESLATIQAAYNSLLAAENAVKMAVTVTGTGAKIRLCGNEAGSTSFSADLKTNAAHTWTSAEATAKKFLFEYASEVHVYVALNAATDSVETAGTVGDQVVTFGIALSAS